MLDESAYRRFVAALRDPTRLMAFASWDPAFLEPIPVDLLVARAIGSVWRQVWEPIEVTPFDLVQIWQQWRPDLLAISLPVTRAYEETKRACVVACADGTTQEALCSETVDDIVNCTDAVTQRCGTGGSAARVTFVDPPVAIEGQPRVRRPEPA